MICYEFQLKGIEDLKEMDKYLEYVEDRPVNDQRYPMDTTKLRQLGWTPNKQWTDGMQETSM